jgi:hypothetical protein
MRQAVHLVRGGEPTLVTENWLGDTASFGAQVPTVIFGPGARRCTARTSTWPSPTSTRRPGPTPCSPPSPSPGAVAEDWRQIAQRI